MATLRIGMQPDEVVTVARNLGWPKEAVRYHKDDEIITMATPIEFGANNWILVCKFEKSVLVAAFVGTADSLYYRPDGAPRDIGVEVLKRRGPYKKQ